jgi:catechol 2,3-dioxygenase
VDAAHLPVGSRVSEVVLTVSDLGRARAFYEGTLGLTVVDDGPDLRLGTGELAFLRLVQDAHAAVARGSARLYHFAILYPSRADLAAATRRLVDQRWPLQGASDHLVSEAVYLADPEGNGIEIYRDRPRAEWPRTSGRIQMATLALDLNGLLREAARGSGAAPLGTTIGHIHLHVRDLAEAERFYREVVGLELMARYGDSASFLAAGGYHHHVGINTWGMAGARPAVPGALGLRWYRLALPDKGALSDLEARLRAAGIELGQADDVVGDETDALAFYDPSGHTVVATLG